MQLFFTFVSRPDYMFVNKENKTGIKKWTFWGLRNKILHTWVFPAVLVHCVLHRLGSSQLPLPSEGVALPRLSPDWTTNNKTLNNCLPFASNIEQRPTFHIDPLWVQTRRLHFWPRKATSLWSSSAWRWIPWASLPHSSPSQWCTAWQSSRHVGNG